MLSSTETVSAFVEYIAPDMSSVGSERQASAFIDELQTKASSKVSLSLTLSRAFIPS